MKFYYNDQLMRTSKNHHYTHAIIRHNEDGTITCMGCSSSKEGAEKMMHGLNVFRSYRTWISVQDGTYRQKDRWSYNIERMKKEAQKYYGSVDDAVESYKDAISRYEIVEVKEV